MKFLNKLSINKNFKFINAITPENRVSDESNSAVVDAERSEVESHYLDPEQIQAQALADLTKTDSIEARARLMLGDGNNIQEGVEASVSKQNPSNNSVVSSALKNMEPAEADKMNDEVDQIDQAAAGEVQTAQVKKDAFSANLNAKVDAISPATNNAVVATNETASGVGEGQNANSNSQMS